MKEDIYYLSRISLMKGVHSAIDELQELGWMISNGKATREDALSIISNLEVLTKANSMDILDEMEDVVHKQ